MKELKHLNKYFYKYRFKLLLGLLITIIARVFSLVMPTYVKKTLDAVEDTVKSDLPLDHIKGELITYIAIIIGSSALYALFTFLMRQTIINISRYIEFDLKNEVFEQYERLSINFYKKNRTGDLMNRISEDVGKVRMYAGPAIMYSIQTLTLFVCIIPLMINSSPTLTLYTVIPLPILSILIYYISKTIHKRTTVVQQFLSKLSTFSQETFSGVSVIKAYGIENRINEELHELAIEGKEKSMNLAKVQAWFFPLMLLLIGVSTIAVIYVGGMLYIDGKIESIGVIAEFLIYVLMLTWPVATVGWVSSIIQQADASQKRINEFLKEEPQIKNLQPNETPIKGNIEFKNVSFTYEDTNIQALKDVSFQVKNGETLAIIGKTGSGKSTILDLIARLYDVSSGQILIDGMPIQEKNIYNLRNAIGAVPQDAFLFSTSIKENIKFGKFDATEEEIIQAAKQASVHKNIEKFSNKYDTVLGERGITLSGGQKQRVSIARALIKDAQIYLFDDCLSAVDTETEEKILNNLLKIAKEKTTIIVSHRISSAKNADRILIIDDGKIVQQGTHNQLIITEGYYKELYLNQLHEKESH
ncbi:ATP-binding cassette, subfamily B [Pustulibacterium marinum]|uniref:ATP-binding cassette, subfamily B n=1 Tax=Pustulibacterium marinum TaxID=1224947 RepID=A0A1I7G5N3_9FLAO|nr:ABC transporter ATP-binding protein [Pustulibacterium marinum]SFU43754.1 ATP-binding cassette, subfamily B [Pustulibacterium marinum]